MGAASAKAAEGLPVVRDEIVALELIDIGRRIRRPRPDRVAAIAADMRENGQREPIELLKGRKDGDIQHYSLAQGWVRLEALRSLGATTGRAVVKRGSATDGRQREIDGNMLGDGLTVLDRARYLAAYKILYENEHPEARHGGARIVGKGQLAKLGELKSFSAVAAARYGLARRSVERACTIGERLNVDVADALADTDWADHQSALETISRLDPEQQEQVARLLLQEEDPFDTVQAAIAAVMGVAAPDPAKKAWSALEGGWSRLGARERREWLRTIAADLPTGVRIVFDGDKA